MREKLSIAALIVACTIIAVSVSAVVGAVTYAGWIEPGPGRGITQCECC